MLVHIEADVRTTEHLEKVISEFLKIEKEYPDIVLDVRVSMKD